MQDHEKKNSVDIFVEEISGKVFSMIFCANFRDYKAAVFY